MADVIISVDEVHCKVGRGAVHMGTGLPVPLKSHTFCEIQLVHLSLKMQTPCIIVAYGEQ